MRTENAGGAGPNSFEAPLWRSLSVFRIATLAYALILIFHNAPLYAHPIAAWIVGGVMSAWTIGTIRFYPQPRHPWPLLVADLVVMGTCLLLSVPIIGIGALSATRTLPGIAVAGPVMAWAISAGKRGGGIAAALIGAADLSTRGLINQNTLNSVVLLLLAAIAIGHVSRLGIVAEERMAMAVKLEAATRTREQLARDIHDSVLQVLAFIAKRAQQIGGETAELGGLATQQESALRTLIGTVEQRLASDGLADLRLSLDRLASATVSVAAPAGAAMLPEHVHDEVIAAVRSALDNVERHAGPSARAWILLEDTPAAIAVTIRDNGEGIPAGRLDAAAADGRLGIAQSISGRMRDLGGTATITSKPGQGTEIELHVPRNAPVTSRSAA